VIDPNDYNENKSWIIGTNPMDIGAQFQRYQAAVAESVTSKELCVETDTQEIPALSNILLIKRDQETASFKKLFPSSSVDTIVSEVKKKFNIVETRLNSATRDSIDNVVLSVRNQVKSTKLAIKTITEMLSDDDNNNVDMLLLGVRNLVAFLPGSKFNGSLRESNLSCSYVHCVLNPIFTSPANQHSLDVIGVLYYHVLFTLY
jgi:hypothetical protein